MPPPEDQKQKEYCKAIFKSKDHGWTYCGFIEAPQDGEIEVFGIQSLYVQKHGEIGLFIGNKLYKSFVGENRTFIKNNPFNSDGTGMDEHHSIQMKNVPVKKGDKILFKEIKEYGGVITQLAINFRPKGDMNNKSADNP